MGSDLNEPNEFLTRCPVDGHPCEGQGTDDDCAGCEVAREPVAYTDTLVRALYEALTGRVAPMDRTVPEILTMLLVLYR